MSGQSHPACFTYCDDDDGDNLLGYADANNVPVTNGAHRRSGPVQGVDVAIKVARSEIRVRFIVKGVVEFHEFLVIYLCG